LIAAGAASSFVPLFSASSASTLFRGVKVMDGGFHAMLPPCPASAAAPSAACVRVSAVVSGMPVISGLPKPAADAEISPGKYGALPLGMTPDSWAAYVLSTPGEEVSAAIVQHGRDMTLGWARGAFPEAVAAAEQAAATEAAPRKLLAGDKPKK
jgi:hypothetical protein